MSYLKRVIYAKEVAGEVVNLHNFKKEKKKAEFETVKKKLAAVGIEITKTGKKRAEGECEYRVNLKNGREATAYYSTDLNDALDTGMGLSSWSEEASATLEDKPKELETLVTTVLTSVQKD